MQGAGGDSGRRSLRADAIHEEDERGNETVPETERFEVQIKRLSGT